MTTKQRSPGNTAISVSLPAALVEEIDRRAEALGLSRSQYLVQLARADVMDRGALTLRETPLNSTQAAQQTAEAQIVAAVAQEVSYRKSKRKKSSK